MRRLLAIFFACLCWSGGKGCFALEVGEPMFENFSRTAPGEADRTEAAKAEPGVVMYIELLRQENGLTAVYRCNNLVQFRSGDQIRFHIIPNQDRYAYVLMRGTSGASCLLFPQALTGMDNLVKAGTDCTVPTQGALQFDENPGTEQLVMIFSGKPLKTAFLQKIVERGEGKRLPVRTVVAGARSGGGQLKFRHLRLLTDAKPELVPLSDISQLQVPLNGDRGKALAGPGLLVVSSRKKATISAAVELQHLK
ncbi:MAG: DUF4384 domain-containing protein [Candidatus Obscuribacter sp.]|nr:DUF4384 domain-containing protein [Candidatus Melainabacteria bacterium]MDX1986826.1 DUF4384 domain-containing protein [Candidatus Obscuribacter sp.]